MCVCTILLLGFSGMIGSLTFLYISLKHSQVVTNFLCFADFCISDWLCFADFCISDTFCWFLHFRQEGRTTLESFSSLLCLSMTNDGTFKAQIRTLALSACALGLLFHTSFLDSHCRVCLHARWDGLFTLRVYTYFGVAKSLFGLWLEPSCRP